MKATISIVITIFLIGFSLNSCKKYEEGPAISFRKPEKRITGIWLLSYTKLNGAICEPSEIDWLKPPIDTTFYLQFEIDPNEIKLQSAIAFFEEDGDGHFYDIMTIESGGMPVTRYFSWTFDSEKEYLILHLNDKNFSFKIAKLTNKEMKLILTETGNGEIVTSDVEFIKSTSDSETIY